MPQFPQIPTRGLIPIRAPLDSPKPLRNMAIAVLCVAVVALALFTALSFSPLGVITLPIGLIVGGSLLAVAALALTAVIMAQMKKNKNSRRQSSSGYQAELLDVS